MQGNVNRRFAQHTVTLFVLVTGVLALLLGPGRPPGARAIGLGGSILYVTTTGSNALGNNCQTLATPCQTITYALTQALATDTIEVAAGTYSASETFPLTIAIALTISGGWNASFTTQAGATIVDAGGVNAVFSITNGAGTTVALSGMTIQNGTTAGNGGGVDALTGEAVSEQAIVGSSAVSARASGTYSCQGASSGFNCQSRSPGGSIADLPAAADDAEAPSVPGFERTRDLPAP